MTSVDEARPGRYKVSLDVERDAQTILLSDGGIRMEIPAAEFHPIVVLSHPGEHWKVERLALRVPEALL